MKKKAAKKKAAPFKAYAKVMGKKFEGKGETIYEALGNIKPGGIAGMVIISVEGENGVKERVVNMQTAKRAFNTLGLTREVGLKNLSTMFDGV